MTGSIDPSLRTSDFDYTLPPELIAQTPIEPRDAARLLVLSRQTGEIEHRMIRDLPMLLNPGDVVVANNTRVLAARITVNRPRSNGKGEILLLRKRADGCWEALAKPAKRIRRGDTLIAESTPDSGLPNERLEVIERLEGGRFILDLATGIEENLDKYGRAPLPPYITETLPEPERYQTVYGTIEGSAAAPTAGLHLTPPLIKAMRDAGVHWLEVTLHIGLDTFRPVSVEHLIDHQMHSEWCTVSDDAAAAILAARGRGCRIVALGTTAARTLETAGARWEERNGSGFAASTSLFITPGYRWRIVDAMLTNFHLPRSTLLMMISAFAGREAVLAAYRTAIAERYRFYSFGDAMLIR